MRENFKVLADYRNCYSCAFWATMSSRRLLSAWCHSWSRSWSLNSPLTEIEAAFRSFTKTDRHLGNYEFQKWFRAVCCTIRIKSLELPTRLWWYWIWPTQEEDDGSTCWWMDTTQAAEREASANKTTFRTLRLSPVVKTIDSACDGPRPGLQREWDQGVWGHRMPAICQGPQEQRLESQ
jgi:hypothetical protein